MKKSCQFKWDMSSTGWKDAIAELVREFSFQKTTEELLQTALETREQAGPTVVHDGIVMPHCRSILVDDFKIIIGRASDGIPWPEEKVSLIILFITPVKPSGPSEHMELIKHLAQSLRSGGADKILSAESPSEVASLLKFNYEGNEEDE